MVSKRVMAFYGFVDLWLLAAGILALVMSLVWRAPNLMLNFTLSSSDLTGMLGDLILTRCAADPPQAGTVLGIMLLVTFMISIFAIAQRNHVTSGLVFLNWVLIGDAIAVLVIGSIIWFYSLRQRNNYHELFQASSPQTRIAIQDKVRPNGCFYQCQKMKY
jgi:hypothetical protein